MSRLDYARKVYTNLGVDVDKAMNILVKIPLSIPCWQGDDVRGFEEGGGPDGGLAITGNYPGRATNARELMDDLNLALSLIPGKHRVNLHSIYAITTETAERDELLPEHFESWIRYAEERDLGLDFNPTLFSHAKAADGLTLSHPDPHVRRYWIDHCAQSRKVAAHFAETLGVVSVCNLWVGDGFKDTPVDRLTPRARLKDALDEVFAKRHENVTDAVESKLFGIGVGG
jgi:L-rhamnose isomerase